MKKFSQKDKQWKNIRVGFGKLTISQAGCFLCCLSSIAEIEPPEANRLLKLNNGYGGKHGNLIKSPEAAKALGLEYKGKHSPLTNSLHYPVIVETDYYKKKGIPQHFVIMTASPSIKYILDPLDNPIKKKKNKYPIVSYRFFNKPKDKNMYNVKSGLKNEIEKITKDNYGKVMKEKEQKRAAKDLKKYRKECQFYKSEVKQATAELGECRDDLGKEKEKWEIPLEREIEKNKRLFSSLSNYHKEMKRLNEMIVKRNQRVKELEALTEQNVKDTSILDALSFAIKAILNR